MAEFAWSISFETVPAGADTRSADLLRRSEPRGAGEGPFQVQAGGPGSGLEGSGQRPPSAIHEPCSPPLPLSRDREQQQRGVERAGRYAGVLGGPGVLPDELVSCAVRSCCSGSAVGGLSVACPAIGS